MRKNIFQAAMVILLALSLLGLASCGENTSQDGGLTGDAQAFRDSLADAGFTVQDGSLGTFSVIDMYNAGIIPSCYGNNGQAPYMTYKLPMAPGQTAPNTLSDAPIKPEDRGLWLDYRLRSDEAIVYIGKTPPACSYFGYRSYLALRYFPEEGQARRVFGSLGDPLNQLTINTSGTPDGSEGDAFEKDTVIITTADKEVDRQVREALSSAGYSMDIVNTDVISSGMVRMGLEAESDTFTFLHRLAFFQDQQAGQDYMNASQGMVLRLTPGQEQSLEPFEVQDTRVRGTGDNFELDLMETLAELRQAIVEKHGGDGIAAADLKTDIWLLQGIDGIQRGVDALGDNNDTVYFKSDTFTLGDDPREFVIVYGVNHEAVGKVTYNNFSMYGNTILNGVGGVDCSQLEGTAEEYLPGNPNARYFYVWKVARSSGGDPNCYELPTGPGAYGIPLDAEAFLGFRVYLEKKTRTGPLWFEMVYDRAMKFSSAQ